MTDAAMPISTTGGHGGPQEEPSELDIAACASCLQDMQTLFRSDVMQQLLALSYLVNNIGTSGVTVRELARRIGTSESTVSREASRLVEAGAATEEQAGNQRIVRPAPERPLALHLAGLLRATVGREVVLRRHLAGPADVERAAIFGSYAACAGGELGMEVNPVIRTVEEWEKGNTGFAAEVRARPTIVLKGPPA